MQRSTTDIETLTIIKPSSGWQFIDFKELKEYRDLFYFLVWREVKILYAQTILGFSWAILQPLVQIIIFTFVFGKVAKVPTEGFPYVLFSTAAIIPWTYMSQAMTQASQSLVQQQNVLGKIYCPRIIFPLTPVFARLVDFVISMVIILCIAIFYHIVPTWNLLLFPIFVVYMVSIPAGAGMWLSAMAIRYRDVKHAMPFVVRTLMFTAPIVYSASSISKTYRFIYSLNPIVGMIEGFRACILGTPIPWVFVWPGMFTAAVLFVSGTFYYRRMERIFVDVI